MAEPAGGLQISRRVWLLAGLTAPLFSARAAGELIVTFDGDNLRVSSLGVHFLRDRSLERLKEGSTVGYVAAITLYRDAFVTQFKRSEFRFVVSYDVLASQDHFAVSTPGPPPQRAMNLSQSATETWCLETMAVSAAGMAADRQFWLQLDTRTVPPKVKPALNSGGVSVDMIELFTPGQDERRSYRAGPLRLVDFARTPRRGRAG